MLSGFVGCRVGVMEGEGVGKGSVGLEEGTLEGSDEGRVEGIEEG
jgi:hypothetical protein